MKNLFIAMAMFSFLLVSCGGGSSTKVETESAQDQADRMTDELMKEMEMEQDSNHVDIDEEFDLLPEEIVE